MHICKSEIFNSLKAREAVLFKNGDEFIDERIRPLVAAFRKVPTVCVTWSCSGHTAEERRIKLPADIPTEKITPAIRWYMAFVVENEGFEFVRALSEFIGQRTERLTMTKTDIKLVATYLRVIGASGPIHERPSYPSWAIEGIVTDGKHQDTTDLWGDIISFIDNYLAT